MTDDGFEKMREFEKRSFIDLLDVTSKLKNPEDLFKLMATRYQEGFITDINSAVLRAAILTKIGVLGYESFIKYVVLMKDMADSVGPGEQFDQLDSALCDTLDKFSETVLGEKVKITGPGNPFDCKSCLLPDELCRSLVHTCPAKKERENG